MKKFEIEGKEYCVPDIIVANKEDSIFEINEGDHKGAQFRIYDIRVDNQDEAVLWYELDTYAGVTIEQIKPIVDDFIIQIIYEQIGRSNEDQTTE